jgi:hypothetical protein
MSKKYKTYKLKARKRGRKTTQRQKKPFIFDAAKIHPASIQLIAK